MRENAKCALRVLARPSRFRSPVARLISSFSITRNYINTEPQLTFQPFALSLPQPPVASPVPTIVVFISVGSHATLPTGEVSITVTVIMLLLPLNRTKSQPFSVTHCSLSSCLTGVCTYRPLLLDL